MAAQVDQRLADFAEEAWALLPPTPLTKVLDRPEFQLRHAWVPHPTYGMAVRLRLADEVEAAIATARRWFAEQGRAQFTWWVGDSATPSDLAARLVAAGARPFAEEPELAAMAMTKAPPLVGDVEVRAVTTRELFAVAQEITWSAFGYSREQREAARAREEELWAHACESHQRRDAARFVAYVDGDPAASGTVVFTDYGGYLSGAATLEHARGRGAFRALVRARWDAAAARGTPALVVQAGQMSRPILERLGFVTVRRLELYVDEIGHAR